MARNQLKIPQGGRIDSNFIEDLDEIYSQVQNLKFVSKKLKD